MISFLLANAKYRVRKIAVIVPGIKSFPFFIGYLLCFDWQQRFILLYEIVIRSHKNYYREQNKRQKKHLHWVFNGTAVRMFSTTCF